jgi:ParB family transcriptional regulator, chromosome partitioning protein
MTTTAAANLAGQSGAGEKEKEKVEKRRALGRGLESLLPGPRVVSGTPRPAQEQHVELRSTGQPGAAVPTQPPPSTAQVPHRPSPVRNDISETENAAAGAAQPVTVPFIHAVVEDTASEAAEPRSAGRTNASAPTQDDERITIVAQAERAETKERGNLVVNLAIADIDKNPYQTRYVRSDDKLTELTESIKANGVLQPIVVRPAEEEGRYILILGERRLHASKLAGKETIPALVRRVSVQQAAEMTIVENLQREDLSPLEQAQAFKVLSEEFKLTQSEIGERVGLSRESVANYMRLLRLPRAVMEMLAEKRIKFAEAKELLKLGDNDQIEKAALFAVKKGMNIEQIEQLVMRMEGWLDPLPGMPGTEIKKSGSRWVDPNVRAAQMELERLLGVRVKIRDRKGKGKIVIEYSTVDDYERVVGMLKGSK